ncbi:hypothetical protein CP556_16170 [Natrinema sp. CBA1119]|nr:hypothetical protein CP556_16170 [Natrinema sp. CBA1119]
MISSLHIGEKLEESIRHLQMHTYLFAAGPRSLRSLEPLAKIYAKKAASADFVRFGGEPLASLADADSGKSFSCTYRELYEVF